MTSNMDIDTETNIDTGAPDVASEQPELRTQEPLQSDAPPVQTEPMGATTNLEATEATVEEPVSGPSEPVLADAPHVEPPQRESRAERGNGSAGSSGNGMGGNSVSMKALLESGVHFGHQTKRWNPKMKSFIFTERNGIHIIDLQQTVTGLQAAMSFVSDLVANGGKVLFIGTKKQAQEAVREEAERAGQLYVNKRWMGGMLTNFTTIRSRLRYLASLEDRQARGEFADLPKAEARKLEEQIERLNSLLGGIKEMRDMPDAVFIIDPQRERIAITEAIKLGLTVVAMVDTNCDPDEVDYIIPSNDDAIRAVRVITAKMADAAVEGQQRRESRRADADADYTIEPGEYSFTPDDEESV